jgi:hypothetical protein
MAENLPEVSGEYVYKGQNVKVTAVNKRGRGYQVQYESVSGLTGATVRLKDWAKGVQ